MNISGPSLGQRLVYRMSNRNPWVPIAVLGSAALFVILVVGIWLSRPPEPPLRISINPWPGYSFAIVAQAKGFFDDEGVDVRLTEQYSLNDTRRAFERHQVDGFFGTIVEVLQSNADTSRDAVVVIVTDYSDGADVIMALPEIQNVADLRGKRIGVEFGTLNEYLLLRALELAGVGWDDVERIHCPVSKMHEELQRGRLDAVVTYPPASADVRRETAAQTIFDSSQLPGEIIGILAVDRCTFETRPRQIEAFIRAYYRGQRFCHDNAKEAHRIIAAHERISVDELRHALTNGIRILSADDQKQFIGTNGRLASTMENVRRLMDRSGLMKSDHTGID